MQLDKTIRRTAAAALIAAAFTAFGSAPSLADTVSHGDGGVLSGNQVKAPVSVPVNACGNAIAVLGQAAAACKGHASVHPDSGDSRTSGNGSVGGGNQVHAPVSAPVNVCGNAVAVAGQASAKCKGHAHAHDPAPHQAPHDPRSNQPQPEQQAGPPSHQPPPAQQLSHQPPPARPADDLSKPAPKPVQDPMANAGKELPFTGANTAGLAGAALAALGLGALTVWFTRRRRSRVQD